jgi:hypothetical protein
MKYIFFIALLMINLSCLYTKPCLHRTGTLVVAYEIVNIENNLKENENLKVKYILNKCKYDKSECKAECIDDTCSEFWKKDHNKWLMFDSYNCTESELYIKVLINDLFIKDTTIDFKNRIDTIKLNIW